MTHETLRFVLLLTLLAAMLTACTTTRTFPAEPHDRATPTGAIPSSYLWDSDADLASDTFYNTRVVSGTGRVTLAQIPVWSPNVRVDDAPSGKQWSPSLAVGPDGTLYAAWHDDRNGNYDIYAAHSRDGGATWSVSVRVNDAPSGSQLLPSLAVGPDGTLYAAWKDTRNRHTDVYFARSTDGGVTWSANVRIDDALSEVPSLVEGGKPSLAVGPDGTLYAAWHDDRNGNLDQDIYFARSTDGGVTWSASIRVDDAPSGDQLYSSLAVGPDGTLYVVWHDFRNNTFDIYSARSSDGGATWSVNVRVDDALSGDQRFPSLAVGPDGTLYAAWADERNDNFDLSIYFARSTNGGATWSTNVRVDDAPSGDQWYPSLAVGPDGTLYAVWQDGRINNDGIYSACSRDGGATWSANVRVDDAPSGDQWYPSLAVGPDGTLYAAWNDSRNCDRDISHNCDIIYANRDIYAAQYSERYGR